MKQRPIARLFSMLMLLGASGTACAHAGHGASGLYAGLLHPFSGMDHLLAMLAVGLWAGQTGGPRVWQLPVIFMMMLAMGATIALSYSTLPLSEPGLAASLLVLGLIIARSLKLSMLFSVVLTALFGLLHGYAHGVEMPGSIDPVGYAFGFIVSTSALHITGIVMGNVFRHRFASILRILGISISASGMWMLSMNLASA